jgi:predicted MPP superfamily phosphohydrolase
MNRSVVKQVLALIGTISVVAGIACAIYARFIHPLQLRIRHVIVQLPRTHRHLDGITMAFVSDTHIGPTFSASSLESTIQTLRRAKPDIVLFGGDYISESPRYLEQVREPLTAMAATAKYGSWGVLGNHDLANIRSRVMDELSTTGITFLTNESAEITTGKGSFWLVGIDEVLLGNPDPKKAFANVPVDALSIAIWHDPDHADDLEPYGPLLQLSGHSHGGQVRLPVIGPISTPKMGRKYVSGRYDIGQMTLFVSNGIGMYRPPVRFNCPPEILVVRLIA